jgi:general secretion pathway protein G
MNRKVVKMRSGFSLLELLIVIAILGVLIGVVAPGLMGAAEGAKRKTVCLKMHDIKKRFDMYKLDNGSYPSSFAPVIEAKHLEAIPKDAWNTPFVYVGSGSKFDLISFGSDRQEGGDGDGLDIRYTQHCKK